VKRRHGDSGNQSREKKTVKQRNRDVRPEKRGNGDTAIGRSGESGIPIIWLNR
jgi:hypothetical protein